MAITEQRSEAAADAAHGIGPRRHPIAAWLTTTDHKKIGIMYLVNSYFWFGVAGLLAVFIRAELANPGTQYFGEERYNQLFTMHGTTMIFLFVIPMLAGFGNYIVPLQIGALDMAFPRVNALSFWMLPLAGLVLYSSYLLGGPADAGWTQSAPVFTSALVMLLIDRNLGGSFFNPANGGIAVLWQNVFWFYSHPAVYVMVLPGMGIISDVLPVFSRKPLFGYKAFVFATAGIGALGFSVWAHHMFVTGQVLLPFFSIMTFLIAVPTGVKFFNWIATLVKGQITFSTAMLFAIGFLTMFLIGGIDGVFLASPPVDFALTETYWVIAHIHYVLFGGSVLAVYAGFYYWFPKFSGRKLKEGLGKLHFWLQFIGFNLTFFSMHILGLLGMPRRIQDYAPLKDWIGLNQLQTAGALLIALSTAPFLANVVMTLRRKDRDPEDPWEGNTLEWYTTSPPPAHNFDSLPEIHSERPLFDLRHADELTVHPDATTTGAR